MNYYPIRVGVSREQDDYLSRIQQRLSLPQRSSAIQILIDWYEKSHTADEKLQMDLQLEAERAFDIILAARTFTARDRKVFGRLDWSAGPYSLIQMPWLKSALRQLGERYWVVLKDKTGRWIYTTDVIVDKTEDTDK